MNSRRFCFIHLSRRTQLTGNSVRAVTARGARQYEFPTGYNYYFGTERFEVGELFFVHPQHMQASIRSIQKFNTPRLVY